MWGSSLIGDSYDVPIKFDDQFSNTVIKSISQHPDFTPESVPTEVTSSLIFKAPEDLLSFPKNGDGWLEANYGRDSDSIIRMCRKLRRHDKMNKAEYDAVISDVLTIKAMEVDMTIKGLSWSEGMEDVIKNIGLDNRGLKALRKFGESRSLSLRKACQQFMKATSVLNELNMKEDWDGADQSEWVNAMQMRKDAQKMWRNSLHQVDSLTKNDKKALDYASQLLKSEGPLSAREIMRRGLDEVPRELTSQKMSSLLKMYGEEYDVYPGAKRGTYVSMGHHGFIIKDIWAYTAGFVDADGSIFISERGDPRVTIVASGDSGRAHCEDLQKMIGGRLVSDGKLAKNTVKPVHRLIFSSREAIRQILKGVVPHLKLKSLQAKAVLSFIEEDDSVRKNELYRLVTFSNWKDNKTKADGLLDKWGVDSDTIGTYAEGL